MLFFDVIMALIGIGCSIFVFIVFIKLWRVLGILERVLSTFLANHRKLWDALDKISEDPNED